MTFEVRIIPKGLFSTVLRIPFETEKDAINYIKRSFTNEIMLWKEFPEHKYQIIELRSNATYPDSHKGENDKK